MNLTASMELFSYWNVLRGGTQAPVRQNIEPEKIRHLLPDLFILSAPNDSSLVFRLTGTRLYAIFGRELHATPFASLWEKKNADAMISTSRTVMRREIPAQLTIRGITDEEGPYPLYEMLLLPLRSSHPSEPRLLGGLFPENRKHLYIHNVTGLIPETCRFMTAPPEEEALKNHA